MKKRSLFVPVISMVLLLLCFQNVGLAKPYPRFFQGVRPMGMGGAFTAVADDENSLFYNPAGLSAISTLNVGILNPMVDISENSIELVGDANDTDMDDTGEVADLLKQYAGENQHFRMSLFPHVGFNVADIGVMIGGLAQANLDSEIRNPVWPEAHVDFAIDYGLVGGVGAKIPFQDLRLGAALKIITRESLQEVYTATDIADDNFEDNFEDDLSTDTGIALDIGTIYTLPFIESIQTDIALAIQNLPTMEFGDDMDVKTQANAGIALKKSFLKFSLTGAIDYLDLTNNIGEDDDWTKRLHMGIEFKLPLVLSLRAGLNQGYGTLGATVDVWFIRFDFATYAEEVGAHSGQRSDRRYMGQFTIGW